MVSGQERQRQVSECVAWARLALAAGMCRLLPLPRGSNSNTQSADPIPGKARKENRMGGGEDG